MIFDLLDYFNVVINFVESRLTPAGKIWTFFGAFYEKSFYYRSKVGGSLLPVETFFLEWNPVTGL